MKLPVNIISSILLIVLIAFACKTQRYSADQFPTTYFSFGNGGGFMGAYKEYVLLENGQLFLRDQIDTDFKEMSGLERKQAKQIFKELKALDYARVKQNSPGNIYKFMEYNAEGKRYRMVWEPGENAVVDNKLSEIYKMSMQAVSSIQ